MMMMIFILLIIVIRSHAQGSVTVISWDSQLYDCAAFRQNPGYILLLYYHFLFVSLQDGQLSRMEDELTRRQADWLRSEAGLQSTVSSLEQELELQREQHSREVLWPNDSARPVSTNSLE